MQRLKLTRSGTEPHEVWENATHLRDLTAELDTIGVERHWPVPTGY
ncbi:hypothetical protein ABZ297_11275 [Nonomuraea sp. NPDC005983]